MVRGTYGLSASEVVTIRKSKNSTDQATNLIDSSDKSLVCRILVRLWEVGVEWPGGNNTRHNTLIVSEKQETSRGNGGDGHVKGPSLETDKGLLMRYLRHDGWSKSQIEILSSVVE